MDRFTKSLRSAIAHGDWYVALSSALTLPDVCARIVEPYEKSSEKRYTKWFKHWMEPLYTVDMPEGGPTVFLSGGDCYALRCSYLHEGGANITAQRARQALNDFHFVSTPPPGWEVHRNMIDRTLQLQVDIFCSEMADAVDNWASSVAADQDIQNRMNALLIIHINSPFVIN
ncbi:hypothetical protein J3P88_10165 [Pseudomonas sp. Z3-6]|uniref:hypothetical protein n=1 Tax=Pseudomonas sp. Z3-6 TaxID=2817411 RepID=UPI003DA94288